eukprot:10870565-Lingulodinium_polyedra.AAC.1
MQSQRATNGHFARDAPETRDLRRQENGKRDLLNAYGSARPGIAMTILTPHILCKLFTRLILLMLLMVSILPIL